MVLLSQTFLLLPDGSNLGFLCWVFLVFSAVLNEFALTADWVSAYLTLHDGVYCDSPSTWHLVGPLG